MCGKYTELPDAYKSVLESFIHAGVENNARVNIHWVATEEIKNDSDAEKPLILREVAQPLFGKHLGWNLFAIRNLGSNVHPTIALRCVELVRDPGPTKLIWLQAVAA